jgi:hypothetical protein
MPLLHIYQSIYRSSASVGFPRGNYLRIVLISFKCLAPGFPSSVRVFITSLPGLSGLNITPKPLICFVCIRVSRLIINSWICVERLINPRDVRNYSQVFTDVCNWCIPSYGFNLFSTGSGARPSCSIVTASAGILSSPKITGVALALYPSISIPISPTSLSTTLLSASRSGGLRQL